MAELIKRKRPHTHTPWRAPGQSDFDALFPDYPEAPHTPSGGIKITFGHRGDPAKRCFGKVLSLRCYHWYAAITSVYYIIIINVYFIFFYMLNVYVYEYVRKPGGGDKKLPTWSAWVVQIS